MTGGVAVILGRIGANFGAGMTGGMAYVYSPSGRADAFMNTETILTCAVDHPHWEAQLKSLIERHAAETGSPIAKRVLADWADERGNFLQICPKEMLPHLAHPLTVQHVKVPAE
jgi:glutamate synthase domain-containing protein 3